MKRRFIKITALLLILAACLSATACAKKLAIDGEDMNWQLVIISSDKTGKVIYCSAEYKIAYPDAEILDLSCRASDGKFVITDKKTDIGYLGTYSVAEEGRKQTSYTIVMTGENGKIDGRAEISEATLHDESLEYNLIIMIDGYTLNFKSVVPRNE